MAREALDRLVTQVGEDLLKQAPGNEQLRRRLLEDALKHYQEFLKQKGDDPAGRGQAAKALRRIAGILQEMNRTPEAAAALGEALELLRKLVADHPEKPAYRQELAAALLQSGQLARAAGRLDEAEKACRQALELLTHASPAS